MSKELKPCPFCGGDGRWAVFVDPDRQYVECRNNDCPSAAIACNEGEWNNRPIEDALRERVAELEAALKPLADVAEFLPDFGRSADDEGTFIWKRQTNYEEGGGFGISVGDVKRADKVIKND